MAQEKKYVAYRKFRHGFTLIELLVVISIIALLLSIMMPSLSKARDHGRRVVCQANLRQQSVAGLMYAQDNDDRFPSNLGSDGKALADVHPWGGMNPRDREVYSRFLLNPYVGVGRDLEPDEAERSLELFKCPADKGTPGGMFPKTPTWWENMGYSYRFNSNANGGRSGDPYMLSTAHALLGKKTTEVRRPDIVVMACDATFNAYYGGQTPAWEGYWHHPHEYDWGNVAFVAGHVRYLQSHSNRVDWPNKTFQYGDDWTFSYLNARIRP